MSQPKKHIIFKKQRSFRWNNIWTTIKAIFLLKINTSLHKKTIIKSDTTDQVSMPICQLCLTSQKLFSCELWPNCGCPSGTKEIFCPGKTIPCSCITPRSHEATQTHPFEAENFCFKTFYCRQTMVSNSCC